jgi:hypothetical protein
MRPLNDMLRERRSFLRTSWVETIVGDLSQGIALGDDEGTFVTDSVLSSRIPKAANRTRYSIRTLLRRRIWFDA